MLFTSQILVGFLFNFLFFFFFFSFFFLFFWWCWVFQSDADTVLFTFKSTQHTPVQNGYQNVVPCDRISIKCKYKCVSIFAAAIISLSLWLWRYLRVGGLNNLIIFVWICIELAVLSSQVLLASFNFIKNKRYMTRSCPFS